MLSIFCRIKYLIPVFFISAFPQNTFAQFPNNLADGLLAYYPFCGNANDASSNGNNPTANSADLTTDRFGNTNSAYNFNGVSDSISGVNPNFPIGNSSRTISQWIYASQYPSQPYSETIFSWTGNVKIANTIFGTLLWNSAITPRSIGVWVGADKVGNDALIPYNYFLNTWYHFVATYDSNVMKFYINGIYIGSKNTTNLATENQRFIIGKAVDNDSYFNGKIDDIGVWNRALTVDEIQQLFNLDNQCTVSTYLRGGNVGIGTLSPSRNLHVNSVLRLEPRSASPSAPEKGDIYFDGVINKLRYYDGSSWQNCGCSEQRNWSAKAPMITARTASGAAVVNGIIYVIGGNVTDGTILGSNEAYNPTTDSWSTKAIMPTPRVEMGVATVNGKIYVIGGYNGQALSVVEEYNPTTNSWTTKTPMPTPRSQCSVEVIDNKIYVIGGWQGNFNTLEVYDPSNNTWTTKAPIAIGKAQNNGCAVLNGQMFFMGGKNNTNTTFYKTNEAYNPVTNSWLPKADLPEPRFAGTATLLNGEIHYIGGTTGDWIPNYSTHYIYTPSSNSWTSAADLPHNRAGHIAAVVNGKIYIIGGLNNSNIVNWNDQY